MGYVLEKVIETVQNYKHNKSKTAAIVFSLAAVSAASIIISKWSTLSQSEHDRIESDHTGREFMTAMVLLGFELSAGFLTYALFSLGSSFYDKHQRKTSVTYDTELQALNQVRNMGTFTFDRIVDAKNNQLKLKLIQLYGQYSPLRLVIPMTAKKAAVYTTILFNVSAITALVVSDTRLIDMWNGLDNASWKSFAIGVNAVVGTAGFFALIAVAMHRFIELAKVEGSHTQNFVNKLLCGASCRGEKGTDEEEMSLTGGGINAEGGAKTYGGANAFTMARPQTQRFPTPSAAGVFADDNAGSQSGADDEVPEERSNAGSQSGEDKGEVVVGNPDPSAFSASQ